MNVQIVTNPARLVTLEEAKESLNVLHGDADALITRLIAEAEVALGPPKGRAGIALGLGEFEARFDRFPCCAESTREIGLRLPLPPLRVDAEHALAVTYVDEAGVVQTLAPATYAVIVGSDVPSRVMLADGESWPATRVEAGAVRVRFWAGYDAGDVRAGPLKQAIRMHVQMNFDGFDGDRREQWERAINKLLQPYRLYQ